MGHGDMLATEKAKRPVQRGEFPALMQEWAEYVDRAKQAGYSAETTISRAMAGQLTFDTTAGSTEPVGLKKLYARPQLQDLIDALKRLSEDDAEKVAKPVDATKRFYQVASRDAQERRKVTARLLEISTGKLQNLLETGEALILREMNR